jgi:molybdopterin-containing oxidoreductase family iron-sulfur binding subunit
LQLLGASAALASAAGCSRGPTEFIVPYVKQPPDVTPSVPRLYATTMCLGGYGVGMVVESHEGRPTKAEGNAAHPASGGALGPLEQASILELYDPARAREITREGAPSTWSDFAAAVAAKPPAGRRTHVLLEPTSAPHVVDLVQRVRARGDVVVHFDAPLERANVWNGAKLAFGRTLEPRWDFSRADVVVALDADFLGAATTPLPWMRAWAERRRLSGPADTMSRLYAVEARLSVTGMAADERLRVQARQVGGIAADLLAQLVGLSGEAAAPDARASARARMPGPHAAWTRVVARDLRAHGGASLVLAGDGQPPEVHALAHAMNELLGNVGVTVTYGSSPVFEAGEDSHGLGALLRALDAGSVGTLLIAGGDPAYTAPVDFDLARRMRRASATAFVGPRDNHTAGICTWFAPEAHFLEAWGDARAFDGTPSIVQPLLSPSVEGRVAGRTVAQLLAALLGNAESSSRDLVESFWRSQAPAGDFDTFWQGALVRGVLTGGPTAAVDVRTDWSAIARSLAAPWPPPAPLEIVYFADSKVYDGRFGDSACLQELADPVTKLTWDNAALVSPATAARIGIANEDVARIDVRGRTLRAPVLISPSMADDVVAIAVGYGQTVRDRVSFGVGANAYRLRDSRALWVDDAVLSKSGGSWKLALTQEHWSMEGRPIVLRHTVEEYRRSPDFARPMNEPATSLYQLMPTAARQWGMTVDLNACTGCSACVVACMAENNIPVVGKGGVRLSREMHWLRIDRYFVGDPSDAATVVQPMLCQHCEKAPCEYVCPVNATVHSDDGLNEMVYNRCVGTRFCSNNCPYKVRRFNFFNYTRDKPDSLQLAMNPDVTVRARGVMEKCTYCVQRIRETEIRARREQRPIEDGEILTACQQTCPTGAIVFGDIADPASRVSQARKSDRLYAVLHDLGTLPRTRYLARVVNPNPELRSA